MSHAQQWGKLWSFLILSQHPHIHGSYSNSTYSWTSLIWAESLTQISFDISHRRLSLVYDIFRGQLQEHVNTSFTNHLFSITIHDWVAFALPQISYSFSYSYLPSIWRSIPSSYCDTFQVLAQFARTSPTTPSAIESALLLDLCTTIAGAVAHNSISLTPHSWIEITLFFVSCLQYWSKFDFVII